jgi:hypothetical protein
MSGQIPVGVRTFQEAEHRDCSGRTDVDGQLVLPHRELLDIFRKAAHNPGAVFVHIVGLGLVLVGWVHQRRLQLSNVVPRRRSRVNRVLGRGHGIVSARRGDASR